jgi:hypothetical protein
MNFGTGTSYVAVEVCYPDRPRPTPFEALERGCSAIEVPYPDGYRIEIIEQPTPEQTRA